MVSTNRHTVKQAASLGFRDPFEVNFCTSNTGCEEGNVDSESDDKMMDHNEDDQENNLHRIERTILVYFLAFICLRSQKQLRWWSMPSPLGH